MGGSCDIYSHLREMIVELLVYCNGWG